MKTIEVKDTLTRLQNEAIEYWLTQTQYDEREQVMTEQDLRNEMISFHTLHINRIVANRSN